MFAAVIENGSTWLLDIRDNLDIDLEILEKEWTKRYVGWLVNVNSMKDIMTGLPISRFIIKHPDNGLEEITHKQAYMLYEMMAQYRQDIQKSGLKKWF